MSVPFHSSPNVLSLRLTSHGSDTSLSPRSGGAFGFDENSYSLPEISEDQNIWARTGLLNNATPSAPDHDFDFYYSSATSNSGSVRESAGNTGFQMSRSGSGTDDGSWHFVQLTPTPSPATVSMDHQEQNTPLFNNEDTSTETQGQHFRPLYSATENNNGAIFNDEIIEHSGQEASYHAWNSSVLSQSSAGGLYFDVTGGQHDPPVYQNAPSLHPTNRTWVIPDSNHRTQSSNFAEVLMPDLELPGQGAEFYPFSQLSVAQNMTASPLYTFDHSLSSHVGFSRSTHSAHGSYGTVNVPNSSPGLVTPMDLTTIPSKTHEPLRIDCHSVANQNQQNETTPYNLQSLATDPAASPLSDYENIPNNDAQAMVRGPKCRARPEVASMIKTEERKYEIISVSSTQLRGTHGHTGVTKKSGLKPRGGREKGTFKYTPEKAQQVRERREQGACWQCALQRDVCSEGPICNRCTKRIDRGTLNSNDSLCCVRDKLYDYMHYFIPAPINRLHSEESLKTFADAHIGMFFPETTFVLEVMPIAGFPTIKLELNEFQAKDAELLTQHQYWFNQVTDKYELRELASPPVSLFSIGREMKDLDLYQNFIDDLAVNRIMEFPGIFFRDQKDDLLRNIFQGIVRYMPQNKPEKDLILAVNKMLMVSYIFGRTCMIPEYEQQKLGNLRYSRTWKVNYAINTLPRMANRQLKHIFKRLLHTNIEQVLRRLDRVYRSSKGCKEWSAAFYAVLGCAMVFEDSESTLNVMLHSDVKAGKTSERQGKDTLRQATDEIDNKFSFLSMLFRWKYTRSFNPFETWDEELVVRTLGDHGANMIRPIVRLVSERYDPWLLMRQRAQVPWGESDLYYGRLVAMFLTSFFGPNQPQQSSA